MACQELVEVLSAYLDGSLPGADRERLDAHLALCAPCVTYLEQFGVTIARSGQLRAEDLAPQTQGALVRMFRDWHAA